MDPDIRCDLHCRVDDTGRHIAGLVAPWDTTITYRGRSESFAPGGLTLAGVTPLRMDHQPGQPLPTPIAASTRAIDTDAGLWMEWRVLDNEFALAAWQAVDAGLVSGLSVEYTRPGGVDRRGQGRVTDGIVVGAALTERPAYPTARVTHTRARRVAHPRYADHRRWLTDRTTT